MFDNLSEKLQRVFKNLRGEGKLSAENMDEALREVRVALLEADVHFKVVKQFIEQVKQKAMGEEVLTALSPGQQVVKIVRDELTRMLGTHQSKLRFANEPPTVVLIVGLQGSGKTTSAAKLARLLTKEGNRPELVSVDVYRPAARKQLSILAKTVGVPVYEGSEGETKPLELAKSGRREAVQAGRDVLLVDTAGRQHIDDELMSELQELKAALEPTEILFVADAMTGQDAVRSADEFHKRLGITGVILTKMDGDARGGAALSIRSITGQPLKFVGVGEKTDALEAFHPDRVASRILGMGDVLSLIEKVEQTIDQKTAEKMQEKLLGDDFSLEDFRDQIKQIRKLGPLTGLLEMMPQVGPLKDLKNAAVDEKKIDRVVAIIDSMTPKERRNHMLINGSRRRRIAKGSGTNVQEVNNLLKEYAQARKMMKSFTGQAGLLGKRLGKMKLPFPGM
ncbi:MAG TPA: signal recognition particle protein [Bryobacteraceae bacterium]|jgi:signal recognition particle subunit SRP54|nr:signal recognition particle protein [Bryobacteraceae bacterium]